MFAVAVATIGLASCGGPSICDCVKAEEEMRKALDEAGDDEAKVKEVKESFKDKEEACKKLAEGKSEDELKELMKEAEKCTK